MAKGIEVLVYQARYNRRYARELRRRNLILAASRRKLVSEIYLESARIVKRSQDNT